MQQRNILFYIYIITITTCFSLKTTDHIHLHLIDMPTINIRVRSISIELDSASDCNHILKKIRNEFNKRGTLYESQTNNKNNKDSNYTSYIELLENPRRDDDLINLFNKISAYHQKLLLNKNTTTNILNLTLSESKILTILIKNINSHADTTLKPINTNNNYPRQIFTANDSNNKKDIEQIQSGAQNNTTQNSSLANTVLQTHPVPTPSPDQNNQQIINSNNNDSNQISTANNSDNKENIKQIQSDPRNSRTQNSSSANTVQQPQHVPIPPPDQNNQQIINSNNNDPSQAFIQYYLALGTYFLLPTNYCEGFVVEMNPEVTPKNMSPVPNKMVSPTRHFYVTLKGLVIKKYREKIIFRLWNGRTWRDNRMKYDVEKWHDSRESCSIVYEDDRDEYTMLDASQSHFVYFNNRDQHVATNIEPTKMFLFAFPPCSKGNKKQIVDLDLNKPILKILVPKEDKISALAICQQTPTCIYSLIKKNNKKLVIMHDQKGQNSIEFMCDPIDDTITKIVQIDLNTFVCLTKEGFLYRITKNVDNTSLLATKITSTLKFSCIAIDPKTKLCTLAQIGTQHNKHLYTIDKDTLKETTALSENMLEKINAENPFAETSSKNKPSIIGAQLQCHEGDIIAWYKEVIMQTDQDQWPNQDVIKIRLFKTLFSTNKSLQIANGSTEKDDDNCPRGE